MNSLEKWILEGLLSLGGQKRSTNLLDTDWFSTYLPVREVDMAKSGDFQNQNGGLGITLFFINTAFLGE